ncbi:hypothetical protein ZTR_08598 [Talaromyces verruculosus]|nr:hypothetical protein ZTR_08598 [Talaromyces verruculosus]
MKASVSSSEPDAPNLAAAPVARTLRNVDIIFHEGVEVSDANKISAVAKAAHVDFDIIEPTGGKIRLQVQEQYLDKLVALDEVKEIHEVYQTKLLNNQARAILKADIIHNGTEYKGEGQVVAVADKGYDRGSTNPDLTMPQFKDKADHLYALGRQNNADDPDWHGTHVCGSVVGDGSFENVKIEAPASRARLVVQSLLDNWNGLGGIPSNLNDLFKPPYEEQGARIHTNSWGYVWNGSQLPYDPSSTEIDEFVWNNPDMVICFAAGNDGVDRSPTNGIVDLGQIGAHAAAKNCITIGASESSRNNPRTYHSVWPSDFPSQPIRNDSIANNPEGMAAFSSRGPTKEGRIKPDVVGPGTSILSARSQKSSLGSSNIWGTGDETWVYLGGTSMATPLVASCIAVLRETLIAKGESKPSAALIKALLINGAVELIGQYNPPEAGQSPNPNSGWGRVNLANSVSVVFANQNNVKYADAGPLKQGDEDEVSTVPITEGNKKLKVTLVWTDYPGAYLQNDLDLIVTVDGLERHGNMGLSQGYDRVNNVEQITWDNIPLGQAKIKVRAHRITRFAQKYACAWHYT